jgi:hypothetical protein
VTAAPLRVFFVVDGDLYPLDEPAATGLGETLRRGASGELGDQGYEAAALTVADAIEDVLVGAADDPIPLDGDQVEAVFYILDSSAESPRGEAFRLYRALRKSHQEDGD